MKTACAAALFLIALPNQGAAQHIVAPPLSTDRPNFTGSVTTLPRGRVQVEAGYTFTDDVGVNLHTLGEVWLRVGLADHMELLVGLNSFAWTDGPNATSGFEDASVGVKAELPVRAVNAALSLVTSVPTGKVGESKAQPEIRLTLERGLGSGVSLASNLNIGIPVQGGERFTRFAGSLTAGFSMTPRFGTYVEYYVLVPAGLRADDAGFANAGVTFLASPDLQLDARLGAVVHGPTASLFFGVGVAVRR